MLHAGHYIVRVSLTKATYSYTPRGRITTADWAMKPNRYTPLYVHCIYACVIGYGFACVAKAILSHGVWMCLSAYLYVYTCTILCVHCMCAVCMRACPCVRVHVRVCVFAYV